jgi:hypothetical protein
VRLSFSESTKVQLVKDTKKSLEAIRKWLQQSGLKMNEEKTKICLFYKITTAAITIKIGTDEVRSSKYN